MSAELAREVRVLRELLSRAEADIAVLSGTLYHAREYAARSGTRSAAWEGMREALRPDGLGGAMQRGENLRRHALGQHGTRAQIGHDITSRGEQR